MPSLEVCDLNQDAVLWPYAGQDRHGVQQVNAAIPVPVRWVVNDAQTIDPFGNTVASGGQVFSDEAIDIMSVMWLGAIADLPGTPTPLYQVIGANTTPDLKNRNTRYEYKVMLFTNTLPTVV